jgi:internalin A
MDVYSEIARAKYENSTELDLSNRGITIIPSEIGKLTNLQKIFLGNNYITTIPPEICNLTKLKILHLGSNQITVIPTEIEKLTNLEDLYITRNRITTIPATIKKLTKLKILDISRNQITVIPTEIEKLTNLVHLNLSRNQITSIPTGIGKLTNLSRLVLVGNQIDNIPPEIKHHAWGEQVGEEEDGNHQAILDYFKQMFIGGSRPLHEAKLIFVGSGGAGKTSLVKRLVHNGFDPSEPETHEVQITNWDVVLNTQSAEKIVLHTWDFGGQQIMHSTHQFFLTERSLYVLVLNGRQGKEDEDAEYWLEIIKSFSKDSPVIIVLNKIKATPFDLNRIDLRQKFPNIVSDGFVATDCTDRTGIDSLNQKIVREIDQLNGLRDVFPANWFDIKDRLVKMTKNYIDFEEYRNICKEYGENNYQNQENLSHYLHLLGIILNYRIDDRLKDTNILNPHWVTKGVYKIITNHELSSQFGRLRRADLSDILDNAEYPRNCYDFLLQLMGKFQLCFRFHEEKEETYLIPNLLDKQQPELTKKFDPHYCLNFRYKYPVLPEGTLPRFIVRTHHLNTTQTWWRSGTVLKFESSIALVKADRSDKSISISIMDGDNESRRQLLAIIRSNFEAIHQDFTFTVIELVFIPNHPDTYHTYKELQCLERAGESKVTDVISGEVIKTKIKDLLNGVDLPEQRNTQVINDVAAKVFYSYCHKDEQLRDELETHLTLMKRQGIIEYWHDRCIDPGQELGQEIDKNLQAADIIFLLVSADFIASNYCYETEMGMALSRYENKEVVVIPIIIRAVDWTSAPIGKLLALPTDGRAVTSWSDRDEAWKDVAQGIKKVVREINAKSVNKNRLNWFPKI